MLCFGHGNLEIHVHMAKQAAEFDNWFGGGLPDDEGNAGRAGIGAAPRGGAALRRGARSSLSRALDSGGPSIHRRAITITVDQLSERRSLCAVSRALDVRMGGTVLNVKNSYTFVPCLACCADSHPKQHLRATPM